MTHPNKRHDGRFMTIAPDDNCADILTLPITGTYEHVARSSMFRFRKRGEEHVQVFCRDEWIVVNVWKNSEHDYDHCPVSKVS